MGFLLVEALILHSFQTLENSILFIKAAIKGLHYRIVRCEGFHNELFQMCNAIVFIPSQARSQGGSKGSADPPPFPPEVWVSRDSPGSRASDEP